jgi:hypothetical protein
VLGIVGAIAMILAYGVYDIQCASGQHWDAEGSRWCAGGG